MNTLEITELGRRVSQEFTEKNVPMTETLVKIAKEKQLNRNQLKRVAETGNTEAYLTLVKTAAEAYVEFPVGDFEEAWRRVDSLEKKASMPLDSEYANIVREKFDYIEKVASEYKDPVEKKLTEYEINYKTEYLQANMRRLEGMFLEKNAQFEIGFRDLVNEIKQGVASRETNYSEIKGVIESITKEAQVLIAELDKALQPMFPLEELTKIAACTCKDKKIDMQAPLVKKVKELEKKALDAEETLLLLKEQEEDLKKIASSKAAIAAKWAALASLPLATYMLGRHIEKNKLRQKNLELTPEMVSGIQASQAKFKKAGL